MPNLRFKDIPLTNKAREGSPNRYYVMSDGGVILEANGHRRM